MKRLTHKITAILLAVFVVAGCMPAMSFADDGNTDWGKPTSLKISSASESGFSTGCYSKADGSWGEDGYYVETDDYYYWYEPLFHVGDMALVNYENHEPVMYFAEKDDYDDIVFKSEDGDTLDMRVAWVNEQSYDHQFTAATYETFRAYTAYYGEDGVEYIYSDPIEAYLEPYPFYGEAIDNGSIKAGETKSVSIDKAYDYARFTFTPSTSGTYYFESKNGSDLTGRVLDSSYNYKDSKDYGVDWENVAFSFYGEKGQKYYLDVCIYANKTGSFTVKLRGDVTEEAEASDTAKTKAGTFHKVSGATFKVVTNVSGSTPGTIEFTKASNTKNVTVPKNVTINHKTFKVTQIGAKAFTGSKIRKVTVSSNVKKISANAFKSSKATTIVVKTKLLKKAGVKKSLKGSKVKTVLVKVGTKKVNKQFVKAYKKIFTKSNAGKKVTVK